MVPVGFRLAAALADQPSRLITTRIILPHGLRPGGPPWLSLSFPLEFGPGTFICPVLMTDSVCLILYIDLLFVQFFIISVMSVFLITVPGLETDRRKY